jgi:hypothetical protein
MAIIKYLVKFLTYFKVSDSTGINKYERTIKMNIDTITP